MSTRTTLRPHAVLVDGDMSGNLVSDPTVLQSLTRFSYAITWSGSSPDGTVSVQVSNDVKLDSSGAVDPAYPGTWTTLVLSYNGTTTATVPVSGDTGSGFIDIEGTAAYAARLIYTADSGTGLLQAVICGKVS